MFLAIEKIDAEGNTVRQHGLKTFKQGKVLNQPEIHVTRFFLLHMLLEYMDLEAIL